MAKSVLRAVLGRMQFTLLATCRTPHGASGLVQAMSAWLVKTRRAPSRHSRDARGYGHTTTAMHKLSTPPPLEGLQQQIENALEYTRKCRVTANVKKCAVVGVVVVVVVVCNEDKVDPVNFKWEWGEDELLIVDQYTYLGVEISNDCFWDAHIAKVIGKGKSKVGERDAILTDPHLDTRIKMCFLMNVIVPELEYAGEGWEGIARKFVKQLETVQMTAAKKILRRMLKYDE